MPAEEYQQLVEFLGRQFTKIEQQFGRRFDAVDQQITELRREMLARFRRVRIDDLEQRLGR